MDTNTLLLIINMILQIIIPFIKKLKKSSCCFGSIEMNDNDNDKTNNKL